MRAFYGGLGQTVFYIDMNTTDLLKAINEKYESASPRELVLPLIKNWRFFQVFETDMTYMGTECWVNDRLYFLIFWGGSQELRRLNPGNDPSISKSIKFAADLDNYIRNSIGKMKRIQLDGTQSLTIQSGASTQSRK